MVNLDDELEGVDVCNPVNVDYKVSADPYKVLVGQFEQKVLQTGFDVVFLLSYVNGTVLSFDFNEAYIAQVDATQLVSHFREKVLGLHF